jgi:lysozyme family protein
MTDDDIISGILAREGGFVNDPADRGGATNRGVTLNTFRKWRKDDRATVDELATLTEMEARMIYKSLYIEEPGFVGLTDDRLRALVVDSGVNHGPTNATFMLQRAIGVRVDGVCGPKTLKAANEAGPELYYRMCGQRARLYGQIITQRPNQSRFAAGWMNRLAEFIEA